VQQLLLERVHGGHITGFANLYRDDGQGIWLPVALILDGWLQELGLLQCGEELADRWHWIELREKVLAAYRALRAELGPQCPCDWLTSGCVSGVDAAE
jgi:hypothetical protein